MIYPVELYVIATIYFQNRVPGHVARIGYLNRVPGRVLGHVFSESNNIQYFPLNNQFIFILS